jgi:hypothetical protein
MRNLLALVGLVVVVFVVVGYSRGWYSFSVTAGSDGKSKIEVDLDKSRIANDGRAAGQKVGDLVDGFKKDGSGSSAPANTPLAK